MTQKTVNHTALPYDYQYKAKRFTIVTRGYSEKIANVCGMQGEFNTINKQAEANAAFMVRACNYHYELLNALEQQRKYLKIGSEGVGNIEELLKRARG